MSHHHTPQPDPAPRTSRTRVAVYLVGTGITTTVRARLGAHPTWRPIRCTHRDRQPGPLATRPELWRALTDARAGQFGLLLVHSLVHSASQVSRTQNELSECEPEHREQVRQVVR